MPDNGLLDDFFYKYYHNIDEVSIQKLGNTRSFVLLLTDVHTHTTFSADGQDSIDVMLARALELGLTYYGISEHFNYDYDRLHLNIDGVAVPPIDEEAYFTYARKLQKENRGRIQILCGGEFGYDHDSRTLLRYVETQKKYKPDFVVNSVHTCLGGDCYFPHFCEGRSREYSYHCYLYRVLESLDAPYDYDIVGHIGYCARNATYPDPILRYEEFPDVLDQILRTIIMKGKILEVNSSAKKMGDFLPRQDILTRYYELGGRLVSFASDAHSANRLAEKRDIVTAALRKIGFTFITVPVCGTYIRVDI